MRRNKPTAAAFGQSAFREYACTPDYDGNTPLHNACAENQYSEAETILRRLIAEPGGAKELKKMLVHTNYDGKVRYS